VEGKERKTEEIVKRGQKKGWIGEGKKEGWMVHKSVVGWRDITSFFLDVLAIQTLL
jgi:hypothetical protein